MKQPAGEETPREILRGHVRFFYDLQKLRITYGNRVNPNVETSALSEKHKERFAEDGKQLATLERSALKTVEDFCDVVDAKINAWLRDVGGIGPTMAGVVIAEIDPERSRHVSNLWSFAGLGVSDGHAPKPTKGEKRPYNSWLRSKLVFVLGASFLKAGNEKYCGIYYGYKNRLQSRLGPCSTCVGTGQATSPETGKKVRCWNCEGGDLAGRAPWGKSDAHRHQASTRYMVKMFLRDLWVEWRTQRGLPVTVPYAEAKLHQVPHGEEEAT